MSTSSCQMWIDATMQTWASRKTVSPMNSRGLMQRAIAFTNTVSPPLTDMLLKYSLELQKLMLRITMHHHHHHHHHVCTHGHYLISRSRVPTMRHLLTLFLRHVHMRAITSHREYWYVQTMFSNTVVPGACIIKSVTQSDIRWFHISCWNQCSCSANGKFIIALWQFLLFISSFMNIGTRYP